MEMSAIAIVGELREALKTLSNDTLVIQARDGEGNGFLPLMVLAQISTSRKKI
jgi:hypothetical protein